MNYVNGVNSEAPYRETLSPCSHLSRVGILTLRYYYEISKNWKLNNYEAWGLTISQALRIKLLK